VQAARFDFGWDLSEEDERANKKKKKKNLYRKQ
jgi:hypothetical protein